ncbi:MAG: transcriptional regulator, partial [Gammaproteobacteria bacterium HGW-Gammaproteobacteria-5]
MSYNWGLIQRLLHEVQRGANDSFKPRHYAEEHATQMESEGQPMPNL